VDKPFGVLVIVMAMFVTVGALATTSLKPGEPHSDVALGATSAEHAPAKTSSHESAQQPATNHAANAATNSEIERGHYLVEEVAKCGECHTPRNENGELRQDAWLSGAPNWIRPVAPIRNWADNVPALAGWPSFTEEQGERILEKGTGPEGEELRPPMHIYHMKHEDAKSIIAYLKSLPRSSQTN
jgi:mono/diheme cytochrome c family protein